MDELGRTGDLVAGFCEACGEELPLVRTGAWPDCYCRRAPMVYESRFAPISVAPPPVDEGSDVLTWLKHEPRRPADRVCPLEGCDGRYAGDFRGMPIVGCPKIPDGWILPHQVRTLCPLIEEIGGRAAPDGVELDVEHEITYYCRGVYGIWDTEAWGPQNPWSATCSCGWRSRQESKAEVIAACEAHIDGEWIERPIPGSDFTTPVLSGRLRPKTITVAELVEHHEREAAGPPRPIRGLTGARTVDRRGTTIFIDGAPTLELNSPILTRPQDWGPVARRYLFGERA